MNSKLSRNLWLFAGIAYLISLIINLKENESIVSFLLNLIVVILFFYNAYTQHKKINKGNTK